MTTSASRPKTEERRPTTLTPSTTRLSSRPALFGEVLVVAVLVLCYDRICALAQARQDVALRHGIQMLDLERHLHIDLERSTNVWLAAHHGLAIAASWYYQLAHLTVTLVVLLVCYLTRPHHYRWARNALVAINALALIAFWTFPVAPPRLLPGATYVDITQTTGAAAASVTSAPDPYAAMPSLHTAWAVWVAVVGTLLVRRSWQRALVWVYPLLTVEVIVATGNHYILDAAAGAAVASVAITGTAVVQQRSAAPRPTPGRGQ